MTSDKTIKVGKDRPDEFMTEPSGSVEDFIRELEEKERDLHITAELEISESEIDDTNLPEFITEEIKAAKSSATKSKISPLPADRSRMSELEDTLSRFKVERAEALERSKRQSQDFENYRRRTERERHETLSAQMLNLASQMLPVLDNLNRALDFAMAMPAERRAEIEQFVDGIILVNQQVSDVLAEMGVQPILSVGSEFNPYLHEAVATENTNDYPPNTVCQELLRGYRMGNRVIRHSMVKVSASGPSKIEKPNDDLDTGRL
jgi:molecular chaperone GrpE (heat shock protein)